MRFVLKALFYILVMNLVMFIGCCIFGTAFSFSIIFNLVTPIICAFVSYEMEKSRARRA